MFQDRIDAGRKLAAALQRLKPIKPAVLALPRGGVPLGAVVAEALDAPLDVVLVRKIGAPGYPELAAGAVVDGGEPVVVWNEEVLRSMQISDSYLEKQKRQELQEIERRRKIYLGNRPRLQIAGRTVIVVDDGIATGATVRAALQATRKANPEHLVLAVPVASPEVLKSLEPLADETICLEKPGLLGGVGAFYRDFRQITDADVKGALDQHAIPAEG